MYAQSVSTISPGTKHWHNAEDFYPRDCYFRPGWVTHIYKFKKINQRNTLTHLRVDIAADNVGVYILSETTHRSLSQCGEVL